MRLLRSRQTAGERKIVETGDDDDLIGPPELVKPPGVQQ